MKAWARIIAGLLCIASTAGAVEIARFSKIMEAATSGQPVASSWAFWWNDQEPLGVPAAYVPLVPMRKGETIIFAAEGRDLSNDRPARTPAVWAYFGKVDAIAKGYGGVPGLGSENPGSNNFPHGVIASCQVQQAGRYSIVNGILVNASEDAPGGLQVMVWINDAPDPVLREKTQAGAGESVEFSIELGNLKEGDMIYVSVDPSKVNAASRFVLDFSIDQNGEAK